MPKLEVPPLTEEQVRLLVYVLAYWAEFHPNPNTPLIAFADGEALSPKQLVKEVSKQTKNGKAFLRMVQCGTEVVSFEKILLGFASFSPSEPFGTPSSPSKPFGTEA
jgi:hypothetical protein